MQSKETNIGTLKKILILFHRLWLNCFFSMKISDFLPVKVICKTKYSSLVENKKKNKLKIIFFVQVSSAIVNKYCTYMNLFVCFYFPAKVSPPLFPVLPQLFSPSSPSSIHSSPPLLFLFKEVTLVTSCNSSILCKVCIIFLKNIMY